MIIKKIRTTLTIGVSVLWGLLLMVCCISHASVATNNDLPDGFFYRIIAVGGAVIGVMGTIIGFFVKYTASDKDKKLDEIHTAIFGTPREPGILTQLEVIRQNAKKIDEGAAEQRDLWEQVEKQGRDIVSLKRTIELCKQCNHNYEKARTEDRASLPHLRSTDPQLSSD